MQRQDRCKGIGRRSVCIGLLALRIDPARALAALRVPILAYHRFGAAAVDGMTVRMRNFEAQLRTLQRLGCQVIELEDWVDYRCGAR